MTQSCLVADQADAITFVMIKETGVLVVTEFTVTAQLIPHDSFRPLICLEIVSVTF